MNTGQTLLAIGAFILLSVIILRVNNTLMSTDTTVQETKFSVLAVSLASSYIEDADKLAFDQVTLNNPITDSTLLTTNLNPESGESFSNFNDFDDFNNYDTTIADLPSATFKVHCMVSYVNSAYPDVPVNYPTWNKKMTVTVSSPFSKDTVRLSSIFSYFYFR